MIEDSPSRKTFNGGAQFEYDFPYPVQDVDHMKVYVGASSSAILPTDLKVKGTHYTATLLDNGDNGCRLNFSLMGSVDGLFIIVDRDVPESNQIDLSIVGNWNAKTLNLMFDKLVMMSQQQQEIIGRCLQFPVTSLLEDQIIDAPVDGSFLFKKAGLDQYGWNTLTPTGSILGVDETDTDATKDKGYSNLLAKTVHDFEKLMTTKGDLIYRNSSAKARLPIGTHRSMQLSTGIGDLVWSNHIRDISARTVPVTLTTLDQNVLHEISGAGGTLTLPSVAAADTKGLVMFFRYAGGTPGTDTYTLDANGAETINGKNDFVLTAQDEMIGLMANGLSQWRIIYHSVPGASKLVQTQSLQDGAVATGTTVIPIDDTIPQNTEGDEYMTLAVTPKNANNKILIEVEFLGAISASNQYIIALFKDSDADALSANAVNVGANNIINQGSLVYEMLAGTTNEMTFKVRAGPVSAGTMTFNGVTASRRLGGVAASGMKIREFAR